MCPRRSKIDFIAKVSTLLLPIVGISLLIRETDMLFLWLERLNHWVLTVKKKIGEHWLSRITEKLII